MNRGLLAVAVAAATLATAAPAQAAPLQLGFLDGVFSTGERGPWLQRAADSGADIVRVDIGWNAATPPTNPRDPADPAYDFTSADASVKAAVADGLDVLATFTGAPTWAEGPNRPADAPPASWRPDPAALEAYGTALATRYDGTYPDPAEPGQTLPKVRAFQPWNEPNLSKYLSPQWEAGRPVAPNHYRDMLNAFYRGVHATASSALVVTAGTAPFGDPGTTGNRMPPARFVRELLCERQTAKRTLQATECPDPAHFDVLAHHPYSVGAPTRKALNPDDVSIPDLGKLSTVLRAAERDKLALGAPRHRLWVTEVSYDSSPPDPDGIPATTHAGYLSQTFFLLAKAGVDAVFWFQVRDQAPDPSYAATNQSGIYYLDGRPKPAQKSFRFPFYAHRASKAKVALWGRPPTSGTVRIERRAGTAWRTVRTLTVTAGNTFQTTIRASGASSVRARLGDDQTLAWRVR
ncbi:hypothetical protein OM076_26540 [Solirubrobacter ginsenosidimutans]|uniref:Glycoside hydrolase family 42 N-terminal domain-containing protein n=1 Tax=Solirubrobacter ginsenosidimutans TaxID=490573 RepID=A0A9X3MWP5_9ACTN|nr:hypothetical protein [Solirubrobacter ginsenosidimutans]MDA0163857.1 hypothetical protein [Solirubrobacter ginsenosidimutans]